MTKVFRKKKKKKNFDWIQAKNKNDDADSLQSAERQSNKLPYYMLLTLENTYTYVLYF